MTTSTTLTAQPTQVVHPWRATLRTALAAIVSTVIVLVLVIPIFVDTFGSYLTQHQMNIIGYVLGILVTLTTFVTRIMAIPAVNVFLTKLGLGATGKAL